MRNVLLWLLLCCSSVLMAEIGTFNLLDEAYFAGRLATYAHGDTLLSVTKPTEGGSISLHYSTDGGETWQTTAISTPYSSIDGYPTISKTGNEILVSFLSGYDNYVAVLNDSFTLSSIIPLDKPTYDRMPYVERLGDILQRYSMNYPYPDSIIVSGEKVPFPGIIPQYPDEYLLPAYASDNLLDDYGNPVAFTNEHQYHGIYLSNDNLYISQTTGDNNGWPIFNDPVLIGGEVVVLEGPEDYPMDDIFRGGLEQNAPKYSLDSASISVRLEGVRIGPPEYSADRIVMVELCGGGYQAWLGTIQPPSSDTYGVWENYPMGIDEAPQFDNRIATRDTVWTPIGSGTCSDRMLFVNSKLWIKGVYHGKQVWGAAGGIDIIGDLIPLDISPPYPPVPHFRDELTLISEKDIRVKYGYFDPLDTLGYHTNMGADYLYEAPAGGGVFIYANLIALGNNVNQMCKGNLNFEYQRPHPSTPSQIVSIPEIGDTLFTFIDLHRYMFPPTQQSPWPSHIDYPWYNPLYPEANPYLERGTINLYGSLLQRRKEIVHREYQDIAGDGIWDIANGEYGGSSAPVAYTDSVLGINLQNRNYPGANGNGIGYKFNHQSTAFNSKLSIYTHPWSISRPFSVLGTGIEISPIGDNPTIPWNGLLPFDKVPKARCYAKVGNQAFCSVDDELGYVGVWAITSSYTTPGNGLIENIIPLGNSTAWIYQLKEAEGGYNMQTMDINPVTNIQTNTTTRFVPGITNDICILGNGNRVMGIMEDESILKLYLVTEDGSLSLIDSQDICTVLPEDCDLTKIRLYLKPLEDSSIGVFLFSPDNALPNHGSLYYAGCSTSTEAIDYTENSPQVVELSVYPNPVRDVLNLSISNISKGQQLSMELYNIKGQKLRSGLLSIQDGKATYNLDEETGAYNKLGSGVYVMRIISQGKVIATKKLCKM
mgnify:CR=1 FL=1